MTTDKITESTSTYLVSQTGKFGISTIGTVNLTVNQYLSYAKRMDRMNRMVDGKFPATRLDISPIKELNTTTLNNVLSVCEETNRIEVYSTKMEYPDFMKEADEEPEKAKNDPYEMERREIEQLTSLETEKCYVVYVHGPSIDPHIYCVLRSSDLIKGTVEQISKNLMVKFVESEYLIDCHLDEVVYESDECSNPDVDITIEVQCRVIQDFV